MDGTCSTSRTTPLLARRAASLALAAVAALSFAAPASAADPAADFGSGTAALTGAEEIAKAYWQATPCAGQASIVWMAMSESTNATSTWTNPVGQYDAPDRNSACQITFNTALAWDWTRFCSVLVHEYGHLNGHGHAEADNDVMYAYYEAPVAQCVAAAPATAPVEPAAIEPAVAPAVPAAPAAARSTTRPRAISSGRAVKRGTLVLVKRHGRGKHRKLRHG